MTATTARRRDISAESPVARIIGQTGAIRIWFWAIRRFLVVSALWATWSMYQADGVENFVAWNDYNAYVYARWRLFDQLGHWEFVNLYTLLPLAAAYVIVRERRWTTTALVILLIGLMQFP